MIHRNQKENHNESAMEHEPNIIPSDNDDKENNDPIEDAAVGLERFMSSNGSRTTLKRSAIRCILRGQEHYRKNKKRRWNEATNYSTQTQRCLSVVLGGVGGLVAADASCCAGAPERSRRLGHVENLTD
jgi:hypothetical protein